MTGFREPGFLWKLPLPFVLGPVQGFAKVPIGLMFLLPWKARVHQFARNFGIFLDGMFCKRVWRAMNSANSVIAGTSVDVKHIKSLYRVTPHLIVPPGSPFMVSTPCVREPDEKLRLVCASQLILRKGIAVILEALSTLSFDHWEFIVLGDGPVKDDLERLAARLGISENCHFKGRIARSEVVDVVKKSHIFLWASVLDSNPGVLAEALSLGVPVISIDHPGYHELIGEDCGEVVPITGGRHDIARRIGEAIEAMYLSEEFRLKKAHGALRRAKAFGLDSELLELDKIYAEVVDKTVLMDTSTC
jgi:glycosyltransferase involved in cell wall biosynthesis